MNSRCCENSIMTTVLGQLYHDGQAAWGRFVAGNRLERSSSDRFQRERHYLELDPSGARAKMRPSGVARNNMDVSVLRAQMV